MSAIETLAALRAGERPDGGLLHSARLHAFGSEVYGEEAIVARFRTLPYVVADDQRVVEAPGHIALFAGAGAMVADLAEGGIARLWSVGPGAPLLPEAGISVIFDPDLAQARGDVFFAASDHPALDPHAAARVATIGAALARDDRSYRARAFVIRAFGTADEGAMLVALHRQSADEPRTLGFVHVAARWQGDATTIVRDDAGEAAVALTPWTPHIGD